MLDVVEVLLSAWREDEELHGWAIMKAVKRTGPTVYGVLDRLERLEWISGRWEQLPPEVNTPRRRFYRLTPTGVTASQSLLSERRPDALRRLSDLQPLPGLRLNPQFGDVR